MLSPRLLGATSPDTINQLDAGQLINPSLETAKQTQALSAQQLGRSFETVEEGNKNNAQLVGRSINNVADYAQAYAVADQAQQRYDNTGIQSLIASLGQLGTLYLKQQEDAAKAAREAAKNAAWIAANAEAEPIITGSEEVLRGEGGYVQYKDRTNSVIQKYMADLDAPQVVELLRRFEDPAQRVSQAQATERREYMNKQVNAYEDAETKKGLFSLSLISTTIKKARTPEEIQTNIKRYTEEINRVLPTLPPMSQYKFVSDAYVALAQDVDLSQGQYIDLQQSLQGLQTFTAAAGIEFQKLREQGPTYLPAYRAKIEYLKQQNGIKGTTFADDPYEPDEELDKMRRREENLRTAVEAGEITAIEKTNVTYDETIALAYVFYSDPRQVEAYKKYMSNPKIKSAVTLAEQMNEFDKKVFDIRTKKERINTEIKNVQAQSGSQWLSWVDSDQGQDILEATGIKARLNNRLKDIYAGNVQKKDGSFTSLSQLITGKDPNQLDINNLGLARIEDKLTESKDVPPEEIQRIRAGILKIKEDTVNDLRRQSDLLDQDPEYIKLSSILSAYKIRDPNQRAAQAKVAGARVQNVLQRISKQRESRTGEIVQPQYNKGGTQSEVPFKLPQLKELKIGASRVLLPFRPDVNASISGDYGAARPTHTHAGLDIAVPNGTPIIFYDYGKVVKVGRVEDGTGYGNYMDIRTRDGRTHRFAHAQGFWATLGDEVRPGTPLGKTGDSGSPGAFHLHWEIRGKKAGEFGYDNTEDPVAYGVQLRQGWGKQQRNSQSQPTKVPADSVRLKNGAYLQDGKVIRNTGLVVPASYSKSNPIRQDFASVNMKDYRRANKLNANYGYAALAKNPGMAQELARTASHLGIPAQWLADVIGFESGFQTSIQNMNSKGERGATGLIQFMPDTAEWLGTSTAGLAQMGYKQQFGFIRKYFDKMGFTKKMTNPYAVLTAIWAGEIDRANRYDPSILDVSDGDITFREYSKRLGSTAGRKYKPYEQKGAAIHTSYRTACATCNSFARNNASIIPHESTV